MENAADRKSIRRLEKAAKAAAAQRRAVVTNVMSTIEGRAWLWDILSTASLFSTTFNGDALQSAFMEGQRAMGLRLLSDIMANCPDQYIQAMRESNERSSTNERRSAGEGLDGDVNGSNTGPDDSPEFDFDRTYVDDTRPEAIN